MDEFRSAELAAICAKNLSNAKQLAGNRAWRYFSAKLSRSHVPAGTQPQTGEKRCGSDRAEENFNAVARKVVCFRQPDGVDGSDRQDPSNPDRPSHNAIMGIIHTSARWRKSCDHEVYLMRVCDDSDSKIVQDVAVVIS